MNGWAIFQSWRDLLFAHWRVSWDGLRELVPRQLTLERFDGSAWLAVTPFRIADQHIRYTPPLPAIAAFPELNVRTYVRYQDVPGVFFFSLDAGNRLAVAAARTLYRLPYHSAEMRIDVDGDWFRYHSRRKQGEAEFVGGYRPVGPAAEAAPGSLEHFLTERYALYAVLRNGSVLRGDIQHPPWLLQPAEARIERNTMASAKGIELPDQAPLLHFSRRQDTQIWLPKLVS